MVTRFGGGGGGGEKETKNGFPVTSRTGVGFAGGRFHRRVPTLRVGLNAEPLADSPASAGGCFAGCGAETPRLGTRARRRAEVALTPENCRAVKALTLLNVEASAGANYGPAGLGSDARLLPRGWSRLAGRATDCSLCGNR